MLGKTVGIDSTSVVVIHRDAHLGEVGDILALVGHGEATLDGILLQPCLDDIDQFLVVELSLQVHACGIVGKHLDVERHLTTDLLHLQEVVLQTVVEVVHIGYDSLLQQHVHVGREGLLTGTRSGTYRLTRIGIASLQDITDGVLRAKVLHLPTQFQDDVTLSRTCQLVQRRLGQLVSGLAHRQVVLGMLQFDILKRLLQTLQRELTLGHQVVEFGNSQLQTHILLQGLLVVRHFHLVAHILYFIEVAVLNTPHV